MVIESKDRIVCIIFFLVLSLCDMIFQTKSFKTVQPDQEIKITGIIKCEVRRLIPSPI